MSSPQILYGRVWKYGHHITTDGILASRFMTFLEPSELAANVLTDVDPDFARSVQPGDIVLAGDNFGYGSSREQAPLALKYAGVAAVVARSFARIFFRNAFNVGLPAIICPGIYDITETGDDMTIDLHGGLVSNLTRKVTVGMNPLPPFLTDMLAAGGLIEYLQAAETDQGKRG